MKEYISFSTFYKPGAIDIIEIDDMSAKTKLLWVMLFYTLMAVVILSLLSLFTICCPTVNKIFSTLRLLGLALAVETCRRLSMELDKIEGDKLTAVNITEMVGVGAMFIGVLELLRLIVTYVMCCWNCHVRKKEEAREAREKSEMEFENLDEEREAKTEDMMLPDLKLSKPLPDAIPKRLNRYNDEPEVALGGSDQSMDVDLEIGGQNDTKACDIMPT